MCVRKSQASFWRAGVWMSRLRASHFILPASLIKGGTGRRTAPLKRVIGKLLLCCCHSLSLRECARAVYSWLPTHEKRGKKSVLSESAEMDGTVGSRGHYFEVAIVSDGENLMATAMKKSTDSLPSDFIRSHVRRRVADRNTKSRRRPLWQLRRDRLHL